jgi:ATP-dependent DNA ligase
VEELTPLRKNAMESHPWRDWGGAAEGSVRMPGGQTRWNAGKDLSWEPLRIERVCEVQYDHLEGRSSPRFRHATIFKRWRFDKRPKDCRYDQLEVTPPAELAEIFGLAS